MLRLGQKVYIVSDRLEMNLPIGEYGYIIGIEKNPDNVFDYVLRVPKLNRHFFLTADDIELEEILVKREVERVEKAAMIDYALATKDEELFNKIMKGDQEEVKEESAKKPPSQQDFIKQIHLKAWI